MARLIFLDGGKEFLLLRSLLRGEDGGFRGKCQGQFRQITEKRIFLFPGPGTDAQFAAEIGSILEDAGNRVILQQWDFANRNFVEGMHAALEIGARVIALLSPAYFAQRPTWARAIRRALSPVRRGIACE
jgi:hypothetical protein